MQSFAIIQYGTPSMMHVCCWFKLLIFELKVHPVILPALEITTEQLLW